VRGRRSLFELVVKGGAAEPWASLPWVFHGVFLLAPCRLVGRGAQPCGDARAWLKRVVQAASQGQARGRCNVKRRPEGATRAGIVISFRRIVAVFADWSAGPVMVAAVRVGLNAMTARTSQAAFAVNRPEDRCPRAEPFKSAWACSMIACRRFT